MGTERQDPLEVDKSEWDDEDPRPWRKHADTLESELKENRGTLDTALSELDRYRRRDAFEKAAADAGIKDLTIEDLGDVASEAINPTLLRVKAEEKAATREIAERKQAEALGFEKLEDYRGAMKAIQEKTAEERQNLAAQAAIAQGGPAGPAAAKTPEAAGWEAYSAARKQGQSEDRAQAAFMQAKREASMSATTAPSAPAAG